MTAKSLFHKLFILCFLLCVPPAFSQTIVTMSRYYQSCTEANIPYLTGRWTYPGCNTVTAYKYGSADGTIGGTTSTWSCSSDATMQHETVTAKCTCDDEYRVASTVSATKYGTTCSLSGTAFPYSHRCDF